MCACECRSPSRPEAGNPFKLELLAAWRGCWEQNSGLLEVQQVLLTAESSFQSQKAIKKKSYTDSLAKDHLVTLSCALLFYLESCTGHGGFLKLEAESKTPSEGLWC